MRSMSARSTEFENYTRVRDTTENAWYAFSAGARLSMVYKNGLALRAGAIYAQNNEIFRRDSFSVDTFDIIDRVTGLPVDSLLVQSAVNRSTRYNRYRSVDLTVQVGYEFPINKAVTVSFNGGVNFNLWEGKKVAILDPITGQIINAAENRDVFKRGLGISLLGSAAMYCSVANRWQVFAEPQFRYYLNPITTDRHPVKQRYMNAGLLLGMRYRF